MAGPRGNILELLSPPESLDGDPVFQLTDTVTDILLLAAELQDVIDEPSLLAALLDGVEASPIADLHRTSFERHSRGPVGTDELMKLSRHDGAHRVRVVGPLGSRVVEPQMTDNALQLLSGARHKAQEVQSDVVTLRHVLVELHARRLDRPDELTEYLQIDHAAVLKDLYRFLSGTRLDGGYWFDLAQELRASGELQAPTSDYVPLHLDHETDNDKLGRTAFAEVVARHVDRLWEDHAVVEGRKVQRAFTVHLHGPWGAGKSSVLRLLGNALKTQKRRWLVVSFNGWRDQHVEHPWWSLLDAIYRERMRRASWWRRPMIAVTEQWRRFAAGRTDAAMAAVFMAVLALVLFRYFGAGEAIRSDSKTFTDYVKTVGTVLSVGTSIGLFALSAARSLLPGSADAAGRFVRYARNPTTWIRNHFERVVESAGGSLAVFIDDLDRCQARYVVQVLEGIQTLFADLPVLFVIAADKNWIATCFETVYKDFVHTSTRQGHRLGYHFVEKAFQLSVRVPRPHPDARERFGNYLLAADDSREVARETRNSIRQQFEGLTSEDEVLRVVEEHAEASQVDMQVVRREAAARLADRAVLQKQSDALQPYLSLMGDNPRAMKRLLNYYSLHREILVLEGRQVSRGVLARWLVVGMRWPLLAEHLEKHPEQMRGIAKTSVDPSVSEDQLLSLQSLLSSDAVAAVLGTGGEDDALTPDGIRGATGQELAA